MNFPPGASHSLRMPFDVDDLYVDLVIIKLQCSPNAEEALAVVRSVDREGNACRFKLWRFPLDGRSPCSGRIQRTFRHGSQGGDRGWRPGFARVPLRPARACPEGPTQAFFTSMW